MLTTALIIKYPFSMKLLSKSNLKLQKILQIWLRIFENTHTDLYFN